MAYSLLDDAGGRFWIHPTLGGIFVANGAVINYEAASFYTIVVKATSIDGTSSTATYRIDVNDVNEAPTAVTMLNAVTTLPENSASPATLGTIQVADDFQGWNSIAAVRPGREFLPGVWKSAATEAGRCPRLRIENGLHRDDQCG